MGFNLAHTASGSSESLVNKADLVNGVIPTSQIPVVALTETWKVNSQAEMLALSGANTYSGETIINAGTLKAGHVKAFGTSPITLNTGATLDKGGFAIANAITNNGGTVID